MPENSIRIDYPLKPEGREDPRSQDWIKSALKNLDKLSEPKGD